MVNGNHEYVWIVDHIVTGIIRDVQGYDTGIYGYNMSGYDLCSPFWIEVCD